jgi:hypothetical protein
VNFVAVKMLTGDRSTYVGLIFAISVASMPMAHPASIFRQYHVAHDEPDPERAGRGDLGDARPMRAPSLRPDFRSRGP